MHVRIFPWTGKPGSMLPFWLRTHAAHPVMEREPLLPRTAEPRLRASTRVVLIGSVLLVALTLAVPGGKSVVAQNFLTRPAPSAGWPWTETPAPSPTPSSHQDDDVRPVPKPTASTTSDSWPVPKPTTQMASQTSPQTALPTAPQTAPQTPTSSPTGAQPPETYSPTPVPTVIFDKTWRQTNPPTIHPLPTPSPTKPPYTWNWTYAPTSDATPPAPTGMAQQTAPPTSASPTRLSTPSYTPTLRPSPVTVDKYARPTRSPSQPATAGFNASAFGGGQLISPDGGSSPVHIVYVLGDDIGSNDLGYQSSDFGPNSLPLGGATPKLDELATSGIILDRFYAMPQCTPSRSSLLSGVHPMHTGLYISSVSPTSPFALPLHFRLLPEYLKMANSATCTHGIGKWDIGHYHWRYLPVHRGFDSWYGYYNSFTSYLSHIGNYGQCTNGVDCFTDLNDNGRSLKHEAGKYSTRLFAEQAEKIIEEHDPAAPLFLYFAPTNCHANVAVPVELMEEHSSTISGVPEHARRIYASCMMSLDGAVQRIEANLKSNDLWNRTLFIFTSDNGAPDSDAPQNGAGSNWPYRGGKWTPYEGGTRVPGFVHSPLLPAERRGVKFTGLFHLIDWTRTFVEGIYGAAGTAVLAGDETHQDSFNQMGALLGTSAAPRRMIIHNIDDCTAQPVGNSPQCVLVCFASITVLPTPPILRSARARKKPSI